VTVTYQAPGGGSNGPSSSALASGTGSRGDATNGGATATQNDSASGSGAFGTATAHRDGSAQNADSTNIAGSSTEVRTSRTLSTGGVAGVVIGGCTILFFLGLVPCIMRKRKERKARRERKKKERREREMREQRVTPFAYTPIDLGGGEDYEDPFNTSNRHDTSEGSLEQPGSDQSHTQEMIQLREELDKLMQDIRPTEMQGDHVSAEDHNTLWASMSEPLIQNMQDDDNYLDEPSTRATVATSNTSRVGKL
jgi:hypothetical protein